MPGLVRPDLFAENTIEGNIYFDMLVVCFPQIADIESEKKATVVFQLSGVSPHLSRKVRRVPNGWFPNRWSGTSGPITWPPRR
jgi:hypothetical protein